MTLAYKALFFDLSGVLYEGNRVIDGAAETITKAREKDLVLRFVTNTATKNSQTIIDGLHAMDIFIAEEELFTAPIAAKRYIQQRQWRPYCLIHQALQKDFAELTQQDPNCVLIGDVQEGLDYQRLNKAFQLCKQNMPLIGIGKNKYFKNEQGLNLDAGAFIHAIEWAADTNAIIMGKPSLAFFEQVVASTPFRAKHCMMVGDDVTSDIEAAIDAGLQACLVKTGKFQASDEQKLPAGAHLIDSVTDIFQASWNLA